MLYSLVRVTRRDKKEKSLHIVANVWTTFIGRYEGWEGMFLVT
jgi:hypothetical protein